MTFQYLEHTADVGVDVEADDLAQAFSEAGLALFGIMTETEGFEAKTEVQVSATGDDLESLLYNWLEELIFTFDTERLILVRIEVGDISADPPSIRATCFGEEFDQSVHGSGTEVKAITYHRMKVEVGDERVHLRYFVDI